MDNLALEDIFYEECSKAENAGLSASEFSIIHPEYDPKETVQVINSLLSKGFIDLFQVRGELICKALKKENAGKTLSLSGEEQVVYNTIRSSGNEGIWTKHLKSKTNLHESVIKKCLRVLEQRVLVKAIKSVKHPTRKLYMLMELTPSVEVTGGPWFTDQELDVEFVEHLTEQCYRYILMKSFPRTPGSVFTTSHNAYPSASSIHKYIAEKKISQVDLSVDDITMLLDVLIYDGKVERFIAQVDDDWDDEDMDTESDWVYRAIKDKKSEAAWQDCPCGVCPVADFCSESGPVNASSCAYFSKWLEF